MQLNIDSLIHHNLAWTRGRTLSWMPTDTQELYEKNLSLPDQRSKLEKYGWIDADISYRINSHGFRTSEFELGENFITLGCSFTFGTAIPLYNIWSEILSKQLNLKVYNLGIPGGSLDTCYRVVNHYVPKLKPKIVVLLAPETVRLEIFLSQWKPYISLPSNPDVHNFIKSSWMIYWLSNPINSDIHAEKNIKAMAYVCQQNNVEFYCYTNKFYREFYSQIGGLGRDLVHPGIEFHEKFSNHVYQDIVNKRTYE